MTAVTGVGGKIIEGLTRQLEVRMEITHRDGMCVLIQLPLPETV